MERAWWRAPNVRSSRLLGAGERSAGTEVFKNCRGQGDVVHTQILLNASRGPFASARVHTSGNKGYEADDSYDTASASRLVCSVGEVIWRFAEVEIEEPCKLFPDWLSCVIITLARPCVALPSGCLLTCTVRTWIRNQKGSSLIHE